MPNNDQERLDFLYGRLNYERRGMPRAPRELRLSRMRRLMRRLGDPHLGLKIVHVAGTKGKGSTAAMMAAALTASGVRTGLYCSPHLHSLEERFLIDGKSATIGELVGARGRCQRGRRSNLSTTIRAMRSGDRLSSRSPPRWAFCISPERASVRSCSRSAWGAGSTRPTWFIPALSIITSISFDHTRQLGNTLAAIATEKAGICKRGRPAVSGVREAEPRDAIRTVAFERRSPLRELGVDFSYEVIAPEPPLLRPTTCYVEARTWRTDWGRLSLPLLGRHQGHNAAVALAGLDALAEVEPHLAVSRDDVVRAFTSLRWPARVEVVGERPWLVIDGAHNAASAAALADTLSTCFPRTRRTLVFGTTKDKDLDAQLQALLPLFDVIITTRYIENARAVAPEDVAAAIFNLNGHVAIVTADPAQALELARQATSPDELICVTGSLFLAAESRAIVMPHVRGPSITEAVT